MYPSNCIGIPKGVELNGTHNIESIPIVLTGLCLRRQQSHSELSLNMKEN